MVFSDDVVVVRFYGIVFLGLTSAYQVRRYLMSAEAENKIFAGTDRGQLA